ncbi:probable beta-1,4-xylosyltransferase IRX14 isoform X2 [Phoenix dactylifera]|uniref:Glycosyltransferases n=1 Tax=Phoenix dactylifera TaxID=42345 RepID=A0A8B9AR82_PHODC|nr:probable beta-1,4-xylosyltransferase IRX14 isoform X2 [Phoenix dactylifera]
MKPSALQPNRRVISFRSPTAAPLDGGAAPSDDPLIRSPAGLFWLLLHAICCLLSLALGYRFARFLVFLFLFSPSFPLSSPGLLLLHRRPDLPLSLPQPPPPNATASRVVVGRHGIRVRAWPHPDPAEVISAHRILGRVQREQRLQYGVRNPHPLLVVTPTYSRTFQALHLTGLLHSLQLIPYPLTWLVVEAAGRGAASNETANLLARSRLPVLHLPFPGRMPLRWSDRHRFESRMRLHALRVIKERRLDGIVVFADDSNIHSMELFDEIQKVKWVGAASVGILAHSGKLETAAQRQLSKEVEEENSPVPIQGPACNSSDQLAGWHTFNSLPYVNKSATFVGDGGTVLPRNLEWAGFVLNSKLLWKEAEQKPDWVRDLDEVVRNGEEIESPLDLLKDASFVEPLGSCGKKVLLWWLRVDARYDSKFPPGKWENSADLVWRETRARGRDVVYRS